MLVWLDICIKKAIRIFNKPGRLTTNFLEPVNVLWMVDLCAQWQFLNRGVVKFLPTSWRGKSWLSQPCCFAVRAIPAWALTTPSKLGDIWIAPCRWFPTAMFDYRRVYKLKCRAFRIHFFTSCNSGMIYPLVFKHGNGHLPLWFGMIFVPLRNLQPPRSAIPSQGMFDTCWSRRRVLLRYFHYPFIHCCLTSWHSSISQGARCCFAWSTAWSTAGWKLASWNMSVIGYCFSAVLVDEHWRIPVCC